MTDEQWGAQAERHSPLDDEPRRCRCCAASWPCAYRVQADGELASAGAVRGPVVGSGAGQR